MHEAHCLVMMAELLGFRISVCGCTEAWELFPFPRSQAKVAVALESADKGRASCRPGWHWSWREGRFRQILSEYRGLQ